MEKYEKWNRLFYDAIVKSVNEKTGMPAKKIIVTLDEYDGVEIPCSRRDLTFAVVSFLLGLHDLEKKTGKQWHYFRSVIEYCKTNYNFRPSDYSTLAWWGLAESENGIEDQNWRITKLGEDFLKGIIVMPLFKYSVPHTPKIYTTKTFTVCYITLEAQYMKRKKIKEPYFKP